MAEIKRKHIECGFKYLRSITITLIPNLTAHISPFHQEIAMHNPCGRLVQDLRSVLSSRSKNWDEIFMRDNQWHQG